MDKKELTKIIDKHKKWVNNDSGGERADLRNADLWNADLRNANLRNADLSDADLWNANLRNANLRNADLSDADLWNADLSDADLRNADFRNADFRNANLRNADLRNADLRNANNLEKAIMYNLQCPEEGSFIGFKKCRDNIIVKLLIMEESKRSSSTTRKCRASKVKVLELSNGDIAYSQYDDTFEYKVGDIIEISDFNEDRWDECSTGIHFFITRKEAEKY